MPLFLSSYLTWYIFSQYCEILIFEYATQKKFGGIAFFKPDYFDELRGGESRVYIGKSSVRYKKNVWCKALDLLHK